MKPSNNRPAGTRLLAFALFGVILLLSGCKPSSVPEAETEPPPGQHRLTASPPVTVPDLDRLVGLGFTSDAIVSEIERRGVLKLPETGERAHIQGLPRGERLLDVMESPKNLLSADAVGRYGHRLAGGPNLEQLQEAQAAAMHLSPYDISAQAGSIRQQQSAEYQRKKNDLAQRLFSLKQRRSTMQRHGEVTAMISVEIDRLEREAAALVPP